ncbi:MAG: S8 family serine peptidase, partial [Ketobacter sp.]|nr:S8 family serine peptidase [Ketobacter sp.]
MLYLTIFAIMPGFFLLTGCSSGSGDSTTQSLMTFTAADFTYYSGGREQDLEIYTERIALGVADGKMDQLTQWLQTDPLVLQPPEIEDIGRKNLVLVALIEGATEEQIFELIVLLNASGLVDYATPVFGTEDEMTLITDEFVVRFLDTYSVSEIEAYIASNNVTLLERDFLWPKCYRIGFTSAGGPNVLKVARTFYESGMVAFAHPDFITVAKPLWHTLAEEDFEGEFPKAGWSAYDQNPADGSYYWGKLLKTDFPFDLHQSPEFAQYDLDESSGDYIGWCSAGHTEGLPDRDPGDNCPETYAPNMDAWLIVGPLDLSEAYWAQIHYWARFPGLFGNGGELELLISINGLDWLPYEGTLLPPYYGGTYRLDRIPGIGDLTGQNTVWIAWRFVKDGDVEEHTTCEAGMFIDDIIIRVSNLALAEPITEDPLSALQWGLHNVGQSGGEAGWDINILPAWAHLDEVPGGLDFEDEDSIIVAVLDEGIDLTHEDLNLVAGYDATYDPDDPEAVDSHGGPNPWDGHGTACAGIIGAKSNNVGIVGVAPGVKIMPVRIAYHPENSTRWAFVDSDTAKGIVWAANNGARVLSNSWGGGSDHEIIHDAIKTVVDMGCVVVCASGNYGISRSMRYPAKYAETIAVGAMSPCGERKKSDWPDISCDLEGWGSCWGPEIDVVAPGVKICTTDITGQGGYAMDDAYGHSGNYFKSFNGTSSATPHVAGIAALMLSLNPDLEPDKVRDILQSTAVDIEDTGFDEQTGYGLVDAHAAVMEAHRYCDLSFSQCSVPSP